MSIDWAVFALWLVLGLWCVVWLNRAVAMEPDTRTEHEKFDDMAW